MARVAPIAYRTPSSQLKKSWVTPNRLWIGIFALWGLILTGLLARLVGSPGALQAIRLKNLLDSKNRQIARLQQDLQHLQAESVQLEGSSVVQKHEIRKVLGYASSDELIFDFSSGEPLSESPPQSR